MNLAKQFVQDYFNRRSELGKLYWYKDLPTGEDVASELEATGQLERAIDLDTEHREVCYLMKCETGYKVFVLHERVGVIDEKIFPTLREAVQEKFQTIVMAIYAANR